MKTWQKGLIAAGIFVLVGVIVALGIGLSRNANKSARTVSQESNEAQLAKMYQRVDPIIGTPTKGMVTYSDDTTYRELPDLDDSSIAVKATTSFYV